ncbi:hypothetical protein DPEC_G00326680 [Dallia pectoralis]|uniref:Uncharacterized protein n=1 Tax=Dallia pectoralis TaxID=75939 RepID=A0ACC2F7U3_DALPE|nr:hypothetical protein DPEC_G00326680 [Dallia pectoralis]
MPGDEHIITISVKVNEASSLESSPMEQEVMRMYSSSMDDQSGEEEDDEEFRGLSVGVASVKAVTVSSTQPHSVATDPTSSTPSTQHFAASSSTFADARHITGMLTLPRATGELKKPRAMDQSQPEYSVISEGEKDRSGLEVKGRRCHCDFSDIPYTNGLTEHHYEGTMSTGPVPAGLRGPSQEPGFADFSVFAEPEMELEPWCCGLSHAGTMEHRKNGKTKGSNLTNGFCEGHSAEEDTDLQSEVEPNSLHLAERGTCKLNSPETVPPSQGHTSGASAHQERLPAGCEALGRPGTFSSLALDSELGAGREEVEQDEEAETETEESVFSFPTTVSGSVSEEFASFCEAVFPEELEEPGDFTDAVFAPSPGEKENKEKETEEDKVVNELLAESDQENPDQTTPCGDQGAEEWGERDLPSSDSFADFHSAPLTTAVGGQGEMEGGWGLFGGQAEGETWAEFGEERNRRTEEESGVIQRERLKASCSIRFLRILQASFPSVTFPRLDRQSWMEGIEEDMALEEQEERSAELVSSLGVLLEALDTQTEEGAEPQLCPTHWVPRGAWRQPQNVHEAVGLRFQWGGSRSNRALLRCLGIDTGNL